MSLKNRFKSSYSNARNVKQIKQKKYRSYKETKNAEISEYSWQSMTMNYITNLSKFKEFYEQQDCDVILIMIDRLTKKIILCAIKKILTILKLITLIINKLVQYNKFFEKIIIDRDKLHTSKFW